MVFSLSSSLLPDCLALGAVVGQGAWLALAPPLVHCIPSCHHPKELVYLLTALLWWVVCHVESWVESASSCSLA